MAVRLSHRKKGDLQSYTILALGASYVVTGQAATLRAGRRLVVPDRIPYSYTGYAASLSVGTGDVWNVVPAPSWTEGVSAPYDLTADLPSSYTDGGVYTFGYEGATPPTGLTLSELGSLDVGTASATAVAGVKFAYYEPGATTTLTLHSQFAGTYPYMVTIYPLEGTVPSGQILLSPDDSTFRSTVLSTWPDGSAQVVVGAGHKLVTGGGTTAIKLRPGLSTGTALTTADIASKFTTGITVNFGAALNLNSWGSPDRIWWSNSQVICARYRLPITNKGDMEAVIDVHAFAGGRALVEVVIENGKTNASLATVTAPTNQSYTNATVAVNGVTVATVSSPTASMAAPNSRGSGSTPIYSGGHSAFRAWYCSTWVGGDPGIEVTHDIASLQAHPIFYEMAAAPAYDLQTKYTQTYDTYVPWSYGRLRFPNMNGGGDDEEIGLLTMTQADYILTGNKYARRAVLATGLAPLSADLCIRHTDGSTPTRSQVAGKYTQANTWPRVPESASTYCLWGGSGSYIDGSHVPNIALVPFLCRPSPCFIELAQRVFLFHHSNYNSTDGSHFYDQPRSRGWRPRDMTNALFLTPDSGTWTTGAQADATRKTDYRTALVNQINMSRTFFDLAWNTYKHITGSTTTTTTEIDNNSTRARIQAANYMHWIIAFCWHSIAGAKVLRNADQTMMETAVDQIMEFPLRWFNDTSDYRWRGVSYQSTVGVQSGSQVIPQFSSVIDEHYYDVTGTAPSVPGPWINFGTNAYNWQAGDTGNYETSVVNQLVPGSGVYYPEHLWFVLCCAVERGSPGAEAAWTKVYGTAANGGITNLSTWLAGFANSRSYLNRFPRNK